MNVNLGPELEKFVSHLLTGGLYQSQSEVVREGLRLLRDREEEREARIAKLRADIQVGMDEADRGEFVDGEQVFRRIRAKSAKKRAAGAR